MISAIVVHPDFDGFMPFAADHLYALWQREGSVAFYRINFDDRRPACEIVVAPNTIDRMVLLGVPFGDECAAAFTGLREIHPGGETVPSALADLQGRGVHLVGVESESFWGQSVAEFALALTLCGLRRIPQLHREIITSQEPWCYAPPNGIGTPSVRGQQFGDDPHFASGTICRKRVRIVGAGNIASRYASYCTMLGANVRAYDPFASDPCFHRSGAARERFLDALVKDADIFAPMLPLRESTRGLVSADYLMALPHGCLVVLVTRAEICDVPVLRERVLRGELSLAADVFDTEPLPLTDPLLGRPNVVHTPHNAGRTIHANQAYAELIAEQFHPRSQAVATSETQQTL